VANNLEAIQRNFVGVHLGVVCRKNSKCGFGSGMAKSLEYGNRVLYRSYRGMKTRFVKLQNLSNAAVSSQLSCILNPWFAVSSCDMEYCKV